MSATAVLVATTLVSAGAAIQQGRATAQAAEFRQQQLEEEQTRSNIKTLDAALERARESQRLIASGEAIGAQGGFDPFSMGSSFLAIREENERIAATDIEMIRLVGANEFGKLESAKIQSQIAGDAATTQGYLQAAGTLGQGYIQGKQAGIIK